MVGGCAAAAAVTDQYFRVRHTHVHITQHHPAHTHTKSCRSIELHSRSSSSWIAHVIIHSTPPAHQTLPRPSRILLLPAFLYVRLFLDQSCKNNGTYNLVLDYVCKTECCSHAYLMCVYIPDVSPIICFNKKWFFGVLDNNNNKIPGFFWNLFGEKKHFPRDGWVWLKHWLAPVSRWYYWRSDGEKIKESELKRTLVH